MGIVRKQSILSSLFTYLGFAVGAINILILFPRHFDASQSGLTRVLLDVALLFATACTLGSIPITLKFYPFYNSYLPRKKNDLPFLTILLCVVGSLLFLLIIPMLKSFIIRKFGERSPLFVDYFDLLYPFTITLVFFNMLEAYAWSMKKTVLSNALKEFAFRALTLLLIVSVIFNWLNFDQFIHLYAWIYLLPCLVLLFILIKSGNFPLNFSVSTVTHRLRGKIIAFGSFVFFGAILNIVARTNDTIILASQSTGGLSDAWIFNIAAYLVTVMEVPQRSLIAITTPFIAEAWRTRDMKKIETLYKKTALNLLIAGLGIFGLVLINIHDLIGFLGSQYAPLSLLVLIGGLAKLIDLATGLNTQILLLSKYWRIDFVTNMLLVILCIPLNYWLTRSYGVTGPAYGNLIALATFNGIRFLYIWKLFKLQPFTASHIKALGIGCIAFGIVFFIPGPENIYISVALRSAFFMLLYGGGVLYFKVSGDITELFALVRSKLHW